MASLQVHEMRERESAAIARGWSEESLMDLAGKRIAIALSRLFPQSGTAIGYLGKGHNAADTLIALRHLRDDFGWAVKFRPGFSRSDCAPLTRQKWDDLGDQAKLESAPIWPDLTHPLILLDGLLGIGANGNLRSPIADLALEMNQLRQTTGATTIAIDAPSGTDPDTGKIHKNAVVSDHTLMLGAAKVGLLHASANATTGSLSLIPIEPLTPDHTSQLELISPQTLNVEKGPRDFDFHKGNAGRVGLYVGSANFTGAAVLAATGALRGGAGLITIHAPAEAADAISRKCPPEIMVISTSDVTSISQGRYDALVIGCGLGELEGSSLRQFFELLEHSKLPTVIDADGLNALARENRLDLLQSHHVITPHPGEFARLAPDLAELSRESAVERFRQRSEATLLLKGSRTLIASRQSAIWVNSTGNPGMASGGQGDFLSGVIGALLARGEAPIEAAALAAWVCGRAAEIAIGSGGNSVESLTASDIACHLGAAFTDWKRSTR